MASDVANMTVKVRLHITLDGEPVVQHLIEKPATAVMHEDGEGLAVHLHLNGAELAKALLPNIVDAIRHAGGNCI